MNSWKVGDEVERVGVVNETAFEIFPDEYYMGQPAIIKAVRGAIIIFTKKLRTTDKFITGSLPVENFNNNFRLVNPIQENE